MGVFGNPPISDERVSEKLRELALNAAFEQGCTTCHNSRVREDECPRCHGDHRNTALIAFLKAFAEVQS